MPRDPGRDVVGVRALRGDVEVDRRRGNDVEALAARAYMSRRTFDRRFRSLTGSAPLQWLISQRVLQAQRLLETTEVSVDEVARRCGFRSPVLTTSLSTHSTSGRGWRRSTESRRRCKLPVLPSICGPWDR